MAWLMFTYSACVLCQSNVRAALVAVVKYPTDCFKKCSDKNSKEKNFPKRKYIVLDMESSGRKRIQNRKTFWLLMDDQVFDPFKLENEKVETVSSRLPLCHGILVSSIANRAILHDQCITIGSHKGRNVG